jgi:hypothetical protein
LDLDSTDESLKSEWRVGGETETSLVSSLLMDVDRAIRTEHIGLKEGDLTDVQLRATKDAEPETPSLSELARATRECLNRMYPGDSGQHLFPITRDDKHLVGPIPSEAEIGVLMKSKGKRLSLVNASPDNQLLIKRNHISCGLQLLKLILKMERTAMVLTQQSSV